MDEDCEDFPNTVCKNTPVNIGLDPGTREIPFKGKTGLIYNLIHFYSI